MTTAEKIAVMARTSAQAGHEARSIRGLCWQVCERERLPTTPQTLRAMDAIVRRSVLRVVPCVERAARKGVSV